GWNHATSTWSSSSWRSCSGATARPSSWSSRMRARASLSPTSAMSSSPAAWLSPAAPPTFWTIRTSGACSWEVRRSMTKPIHFKRAAMAFETYGGPPGAATVARLVGPDVSTSMGAGIATFDGCSIEWTVLYDEVIVVLQGTFRLRIGEGYKETIEAGPGDVIWLPETTPLKYEGDKATVFYALHPVDWRWRHGMA